MKRPGGRAMEAIVSGEGCEAAGTELPVEGGDRRGGKRGVMAWCRLAGRGCRDCARL